MLALARPRPLPLLSSPLLSSFSTSFHIQNAPRFAHIQDFFEARNAAARKAERKAADEAAGLLTDPDEEEKDLEKGEAEAEEDPTAVSFESAAVVSIAIMTKELRVVTDQASGTSCPRHAPVTMLPSPCSRHHAP